MTTAVRRSPSRPSLPVCLKSSIVVMAPQCGHVAPARDIVPRVSVSVRDSAAPTCLTPNTALGLPGSVRSVRTTRLPGFRHSHFVHTSGTSARQFLQVTVLAQR